MRRSPLTGRIAGLGTVLLVMVAGCSNDDVGTATQLPATTQAATTATSRSTTPPTTVVPLDVSAAPQGTFFAGTLPMVWETIPAGTRVPFGNVVWTPSGYAVAEATVDRAAADRDLLWTSPDGVSWSSAALPVEATLPLLVRTDDGYWLTSHGDDVRVWHSTNVVEWVEVDTAAVRHLRPFLMPYTDLGSVQPLNDLTPWREGAAWTSNGSVVVGQWLNDGFLGSLVVSDGLRPFTEVAAPWGAVWADIVSSDGTFYAYVAFGLEPTPGEIWTSRDGVTWLQASSELSFKFDSRGEPAHSFEVVERNGIFMAQAGFFCGLGDLSVSFDGIDFGLVGTTPDAGTACGGSIHGTDFGFVLVTDGGTDPIRPSIWVSVNGTEWSQVDLDGLGIVGGDGSTPRSQLEVTVERDAIFVHNLMAVPGPMWVGRPVVVVEIGDGECASTIGDGSKWGHPLRSSSPVNLEIRNQTSTASAVVLGSYSEGSDRSDLIEYGRDISTRPPFIEDAQVFQVGAGQTATVEFHGDPGHYAAVCMDTTSTMVVLDDLVVEG